MNKKTLIIIITITILGLAIIAGGFYLWSQKKADLKHVNVEKRIIENDKQEQKGDGGNRKNGIVEKEDEGKKEGNGNQENEKQVEIDYNPHTQLTKQEIEKLKKEKDLVWYEIPELGIKFLVTKDAKEDLRYDYKINKNKKSAKLYWQSEIDFLPQQRCFDKQNDNLCTIGILNKILVKNKKKQGKETGQSFCWGIQIITINNNSLICFIGPQAWNFISVKEYNEYLKTIKDKNLEIYLGTMEPISTK